MAATSRVPYAFIDTNVWIRLLSQAKPGCEPEHFAAVRNLVDGEKLILILPEIIELELEKTWREFSNAMTKEIGQIEQKVTGVFAQKLWTEIADIQGALLTFLREKKEQKIRSAEEHYKCIQQFFLSPKIARVPFTSELNFLSRKRLIAGRMPEPENKASNDAAIIESLIKYLRTRATADTQLIFCSENSSDFGLQTKEGLVIHPTVKEGLPPSKFVTTLSELLACYQTNAPIREPNAEEIEEALERRAMAAADRGYVRWYSEGCLNPVWVIGPFCQLHFEEHYYALSTADRERFRAELELVLQTLTYREREVFKLRTGFGDGYMYTLDECSRIFKCSKTRIRDIEANAIRKLQQPSRVRRLDNLF